MTHKHGKRDSNHAAIVSALRQAGCFVVDLGDVGGGCPDVAAMRNGVTTWFELKRETGRSRIESAQVTWHEDALAKGVKVHIVRSATEALVAVNCAVWGRDAKEMGGES